MPPDLADHAFGHCVAVLGDTAAAVTAATAAVRRGGRSRVVVLAFARDAALQAAATATGDDAAGGGGLAPQEVEPADINELARALAGTRPAVERAVVDLDLRHDLDRAALGRTFGITPTEAATLAAGVAEVWDRDLDPALLAWLGPGECRGLADALAAAGLWMRVEAAQGDVDGAGAGADADAGLTRPQPDQPEPDGADATTETRLDTRPDQLHGATAGATPAGRTVAALLAAAATVAAHTEQCELCTDRRRAMVTVRSIVGRQPLEHAPEAVRSTARRSPFRVGPLPPPSPAYQPAAAGTGAAQGRPSPRLVRRAVACAGAVGVGVAGLAITRAVAEPSGQDRRNHRVAALTKVPAAGSSLTITPAEVRPSAGAMLLRNTSSHAVTWTVTVAEPWLEVLPVKGRLDAGGVAELDTRILAAAPEGDQRVKVTVAGDDGSTAGALVDSTVEHPPTLSAALTGCVVQAEVDDEGAITSVFLHWHSGPDTQDHLRAMAAVGDPGAYTGALRPEDHPTSWWVTAVDSRGNRGQSDELPVTPGTC